MDKECQDLTDRLSAYLDGDLAGDDLEEIIKHLDECGCCRECLGELRQVRDALRKMKAPEVPAGLTDRLKACLKQNRNK
ncbi:MAG TPA: zf-HC2 domain-containing protein [bacterium]|nr:zf-HC2 domain-containing protein [bacterium]